MSQVEPREIEPRGPKQDLVQMEKTGRFDDALMGYAQKCRDALRRNDQYFAETCIERMVELLGRRFKQPDWARPGYFAEFVRPALGRLLTDLPDSVSPELVEELMGLAEAKFTSDEFVLPRALRRE